MTTNDILPGDNAYDEVIYERDLARSVPLDNYVEMYPSDPNGYMGTSKNGTYNIVSKDYGDHQVNYYIPREYGDEFGIQQLEEMSLVNDQPYRNSAGYIPRRMYQPYDEYDPNNGVEYVEEVPMMMTPRTMVNVSPRRQRQPQVIREVYEPTLPIPTETVEYVYETQPPPIIEEETEYIIEQPVYVEAPQPTPRTVIIKQPPPPPPPPPVQRTIIIKEPPPPASPPVHTIVVQEPPPPPPAPVQSPRRKILVARTPPPESPLPPRRTMAVSRSPSPDPAKSSRRSLVFPKSPPIPTLRNANRRTEVVETYSSRTARTNQPLNEQPLSLMEVVAQNRANRRGKVPKPRREVSEDKLYDLPTYHKNVIKNGFMVHK
ncbi:unnamed protein product [Adineta ricciae]|uniref:Uncharacterized protein n=1 Tax=Adineta ricciae TaxID=249248 RepID=A0A814SNV7_ADIRI|nr:unnamed protein product [Adineta ricciae]